ncbi:multimerin-2-like [Mytilus californianus]|uniref:multimerin-2-like n=1 Tax=Mytilus californianus TaxID=6549 RepID=UPI00224695AD|nr:multimerin-2-like [Mytilus californianus]
MFFGKVMVKMLLVCVLLISLMIVASGSSSIGSNSESLMSCSKFHFEEKVLEKLVRLEHKMDLNKEKLKKWEKTFSYKLEKMDEAIKQTEIFVKSMRDIQLQEQLRHNDSYHEIVERFKIQSKNETEYHGEQINTMLESLSSKIEELIVAEKNRNNAMELMQNTLHQEQKRFNQSFDLTLQNFRLSSNGTVHQLIEKQQKDYEALVKKQSTVAFSAYTTHSQYFSSRTNVKFEKVWTNIGNGYDPSTGIFTAPRQGVYHISAAVISANGKSLYLQVKHNSEYTAGSYVTGDGHKTGTFDVVFSLQKGDKISVENMGGYTVYSNTNRYTTFSGHRIV